MWGEPTTVFRRRLENHEHDHETQSGNGDLRPERIQEPQTATREPFEQQPLTRRPFEKVFLGLRPERIQGQGLRPERIQVDAQLATFLAMHDNWQAFAAGELSDGETLVGFFHASGLRACRDVSKLVVETAPDHEVSVQLSLSKDVLAVILEGRGPLSQKDVAYAALVQALVPEPFGIRAA